MLVNLILQSSTSNLTTVGIVAGSIVSVLTAGLTAYFGYRKASISIKKSAEDTLKTDFRQAQIDREREYKEQMLNMQRAHDKLLEQQIKAYTTQVEFLEQSLSGALAKLEQFEELLEKKNTELADLNYKFGNSKGHVESINKRTET